MQISGCTYMEKAIIEFGDIEIEKQTFHQHKRPILMKNIDINKIAVYNKISNTFVQTSPENECIWKWF